MPAYIASDCSVPARPAAVAAYTVFWALFLYTGTSHQLCVQGVSKLNCTVICTLASLMSTHVQASALTACHSFPPFVLAVSIILLAVVLAMAWITVCIIATEQSVCKKQKPISLGVNTASNPPR